MAGPGTFYPTDATPASDDRIPYIDPGTGKVYTQTRGQLHALADAEALYFGTANDAAFAWDGTNLELLPVADDTGAFNIGDGTTDFDVKVFLGTTTDAFIFDVGAKSLRLDGDCRIDLSEATSAAANTDGFVIKAGTSGSPVVEDTAGKFISFYWDCGATSGDTQGIYNRLYLTGAGVGGDALRSFVTVSDVAASTVRGAHISASFGTTGSITGLGTALECTLHAPNSALTAGTYSAIKAAINADGSSTDVSGATSYAVFNVVAQGTQAGIDTVDSSADFIDFDGFNAGSGEMIDTDITTHTAYGGLRVNISGVGDRWIALVSA